MKQVGSVISTSQEVQRSRIGMPHGEHGSVTHGATTSRSVPALPLDQARQAMHSSPVLRGQYPRSKDEAESVKAMLPSLSAPAQPQEIAKMVAILLNMYFVVDQRSEVFKGIAARWLDELKDFPEWAIDRSVAWWTGRNNPKRDRRPMPGDIAARAKREMGHISAAQQQIKFFEKYGDNPPEFVKAGSRSAQN